MACKYGNVLVQMCRFFVRHPARMLVILLLIMFILLSRIIYTSDPSPSYSLSVHDSILLRGKLNEVHSTDRELKKKQSEDTRRWDKEMFSTMQDKQKLAQTAKTGETINGETENVHENNVLMTLVKVGMTSPLARSFRRCVNSICAHTRVPLTFNVVVDNVGMLTTQDAFKIANETCRKSFTVKYYSMEKVVGKVRSFTKALQELFSTKQSYYSDPVFFLSVAIHYVLPQTMSKVIMLDSDLEFRSDIGELFQHFDQFNVSNIFGLAREQQPVYRHIFHMFRKGNVNTRVGGPPPDGLTGFNSGVLLIDLYKMRKSRVYDQILVGGIVKEIAEQYQFQGHLGDQDFYTVISIKYSELFYILPCSWNRQLCTWWRDNGYSDIFQSYHNCSEPIHVYHGNCRTMIPKG